MPRQLVGLGLLVAFVVGAACAPATPPASTPAARPAATGPALADAQPVAAAPTAGPRRTRLDFAISSFVAGYWVTYVGMDRGFFDAEGIELDLVLTETSGRAAQTLLGGTVDIANTSADVLIMATEKGADIATVGVEGARPVYSVIAQPSIPNVPALRGQKVAISDLKGGPTLMLLRTLAHFGVHEADIDLIPSGGTGARFAALKSGAVAAAAMTQPDDFRALDDGFARLAVTTEAVHDYAFNAMAVRRDWGRDHADELVRYLRAFRRAATWLYEPANREEAIAVLSERTKLDEKYARLTYELLVLQERAYAEEGRVDPAGFQAALELLADAGELSRPLPNPARYIDTSYWERAAPR
jgi:ABC-type nitrate/sulfonate/bicarbonate transport system substrate-binding protein